MTPDELCEAIATLVLTEGPLSLMEMEEGEREEFAVQLKYALQPAIDLIDGWVLWAEEEKA